MDNNKIAVIKERIERKKEELNEVKIFWKLFGEFDKDLQFMLGDFVNTHEKVDSEIERIEKLIKYHEKSLLKCLDG